MSERTLYEFVRESNRIEGVIREPKPEEIVAHERLLAREFLNVGDLRLFVEAVANAPLREKGGYEVRVGSHFPPPGGPAIVRQLSLLLGAINDGDLTPYEAHCRYEELHPFMDGNGRSGRAVWAWQMRRDGLDPFALPFLHRFYYQTLDGQRAKP